MATPEEYYELLKLAATKGAEASKLAKHLPTLLDGIYPENSYPGLSLGQRAVVAEDDLKTAISTLPKEPIDVPGVLLIMLGLTPETANMGAIERMELAAKTHLRGVSYRSARRYRSEYMWALSITLYKGAGGVK